VVGRLKKSKFKFKNTAWYLCCLILVAAIVVIVFGIYNIRKNHHANQVAIQQAIKSGVAPKTNKPTQAFVANYTVPPDLPRYISIPSIGVHAIVGAVGLTRVGAIGTPDNVYNTDWYDRSSKPGQLGAALIDGHVSSWTTDGVFYNIKKLVAGDKIQIQLGNGSLINYSVVKSQIYPNTDVNISAALSSVNPNVPGLNLITCTGDVIKGTNEFNERIVVFAQQV
jgi:sortase A